MGILRSIATSFLSFILFLTLTIFSVAFMLQGTVLNSDFVSDQVDKVPISDIARDFGDELISSELPQDMPFMKDVALNVVEKQEPWIKEQLKDAIDTGYDYLLGDTETLRITIPLSELKENLGDSLWDETQAYLQKELATKSESEISRYLQDIIRQIPKDILPTDLAILPSDLRNLAIEQYLRDFAGQKPVFGLPPEITAPVQESAREYFDQYLNDFIKDIPDTYTIDEDTLGHQTMDALSTARTVVDYFQTYYPWMIVLILVLAALIFVANMNIRATARALGTNLCIFGGLDLIGIIVVKVISPFHFLVDVFDIPSTLSNWMEGAANDVTSVALPLAIGLLVVGVALLVVSFIIKPREA
ncbi:MAG: hypothetical protein A2Y58_06040 [Chloroflexi bacterium RBG_13_51_52]|nr:MAG: hypothetical protein A2Y58_06040 [Chloroflexi bacterium RBG_13_51_52]